MNALASSSSSSCRTLCSSLTAIRLSRRAYPSSNPSSSSTPPPPPPSFSSSPNDDDASTSTTSPSSRRPRKPKWTPTQLRNRDYQSIGLPPSLPSHEIAYQPIKRKRAKALEAARLLKLENAGRDAEGKRRRDGSAWLSSEEFELKLYKDDLKERKKKLALDEMLGTGAIARKRWAWEWFKEGKELRDIGVKMARVEVVWLCCWREKEDRRNESSSPPFPSSSPSFLLSFSSFLASFSTLVDPPRSQPFAAPRMVEWILTHLSRPPRDEVVVEPSHPSSSSSPTTVPPTSSSGPTRSKYINSLHLLTPTLWNRLTEAHPSWQGYTYTETVGSQLHNETHANMALFDLLWRNGWRGEGLLSPRLVGDLRAKEVEERSSPTPPEPTTNSSDASNEQEEEIVTVSETRNTMRMMWDKAGEDCPIPGDVMRSYLALPAPASENVEVGNEGGWGAAEDLAVEGEERELDLLRQDQLRLARKADQLRSTQALGGPAAVLASHPPSPSRSRQQKRSTVPAAPTIAPARGVGIEGGVPESVKIAELLAAVGEKRRIEAGGGEEAMRKKEVAHRKQLKNDLGWWAAKDALREERKREEGRRREEAVGKRGEGGRGGFEFQGPEGSSPWKEKRLE